MPSTAKEIIDRLEHVQTSKALQDVIQKFLLPLLEQLSRSRPGQPRKDLYRRLGIIKNDFANLCKAESQENLLFFLLNATIHLAFVLRNFKDELEDNPIAEDRACHAVLVAVIQYLGQNFQTLQHKITSEEDPAAGASRHDRQQIEDIETHLREFLRRFLEWEQVYAAQQKTSARERVSINALLQSSPQHDILLSIILILYLQQKRIQRAEKGKPFNCYFCDAEEIGEIVCPLLTGETPISPAEVKEKLTEKEVLGTSQFFKFVEDFLADPRPRQMQLLVHSQGHYTCVNFAILPDGRREACILDAAEDQHAVALALTLASIEKFTTVYVAVHGEHPAEQPLQRDGYSCPVFAMDHATHLSDRVFQFDNILTKNRRLLTKAENCVLLNWAQLPPELIWNAQLNPELDFAGHYLEALFGRVPGNKKGENFEAHLDRTTRVVTSERESRAEFPVNVATDLKMFRYILKALQELETLKDADLQKILEETRLRTTEIPQQKDLAVAWFSIATEIATDSVRRAKLKYLRAHTPLAEVAAAAAAAPPEEPKHNKP